MYVPPISEETQDAIDDVDEDINDIVENIPDDFDWINEDITEIPDFYIPEEEFTIPFDEEFAFDDIYIDELTPQCLCYRVSLLLCFHFLLLVFLPLLFLFH